MKSFKRFLEQVNEPGGSRPHVFYEEDSSQRDQALSLPVKKLRRGSSRGYSLYPEDIPVHIDGRPVKMAAGVKRAVPSKDIDPYLDFRKYKKKGKGMGHLQNEAEAHPHNDKYRVLHRIDNSKFVTNKAGIFAPLLNHDQNHQWLEVGHVADATAHDWSELTKTKTHPKGIRHADFYDALHHAVYGTEKEYKPATNEKRKKQLESLANHPLVQSFINYHRDTKVSVEDFAGRSNFGVWTHPHTGTRQIVARDIGWSDEIEAARTKAQKNRFY